jgi:hypothetical protein
MADLPASAAACRIVARPLIVGSLAYRVSRTIRLSGDVKAAGGPPACNTKRPAITSGASKTTSEENIVATLMIDRVRLMMSFLFHLIGVLDFDTTTRLSLHDRQRNAPVTGATSSRVTWASARQLAHRRKYDLARCACA